MDLIDYLITIVIALFAGQLGAVFVHTMIKHAPGPFVIVLFFELSILSLIGLAWLLGVV